MSGKEVRNVSNRKRDQKQVNAAIGMCVGLVIGAVGLVVCTRLGYTAYATVPVIACMVIGGIVGMLLKKK